VHRAGADDERFATLVYAVWEPGSPALELAVAGHPPPLLIDPAGARFVDAPTGPPLGAAVEPAEYVTHRMPLDRSGTTMLVLYTDGLVERPERHIGESLDPLRAQAAAVVHPDPHDLADYLIAGLRPASGWNDDVALLVCNLAVPGTATG
jgi:serine phosphatase RsbU (regulator of sigma subunit)